MVDRSEFADFLDRLADGRKKPPESKRYLLAHYADPFLEEMRRCTVRLMGNYLPYHGNTEPGREALRCWAMALRSAGDVNSTNEVILAVTPEEAVVLHEILSKFSTTDRLTIQNPGEEQALRNLECVIEKLCDNQWPSLEESLAALSPQGN